MLMWKETETTAGRTWGASFDLKVFLNFIQSNVLRDYLDIKALQSDTPVSKHTIHDEASEDASYSS
jgi:hypothetical protein